MNREWRTKAVAGAEATAAEGEGRDNCDGGVRVAHRDRGRLAMASGAWRGMGE